MFDKQPKDYTNALLKLLPNGTAWDTERENTSGDVYRLLDAQSFEHHRLGSKIRQLADESTPDTADELIADWERFYGLTPSAGATLVQRRLAIMQASLGNKNRTEPPLRLVAESYGLSVEFITSKDIQMWAFNRDNAIVGNRIYNLNYRHSLLVKVLNSNIPNPEFEAAIRKVALAHLSVRFIYV